MAKSLDTRFDKPWPQNDTDETRKWIETELEHDDIIPWQIVLRAMQRNQTSVVRSATTYLYWNDKKQTSKKRMISYMKIKR